jgi:predicted NAD/FAD-binding protein
MKRQSIAIIGGGIAGLTTARNLYKDFDIELFEYNDYIGGHTHTKHVTHEGVTYPINTGFIVFNDWVYHNFNKLIEPLGVNRIPTEMSFSVTDEKSGLEYNGHNLDSLFAQRSNLFSPKFYKMIKDILKFNKQSLLDLEADRLNEELTLTDYFKELGVGQMFIEKYIVPMGAAIWSSGEADMLDFPALFFVRFFKNHGLLSIKDRPQWYVLENGSESYVEPLTRPFRDSLHINARIDHVSRNEEGVTIQFESGTQKSFDQVVFACHSDQALTLLKDPTDLEKDILGAIPYSKNEVVLHTDETILPKRKKAWAAWNYHLDADKTKPASLTYNMNILQNFNDAPVTFCVTLNRTNLIDPAKVISKYQYAHPIFNKGSIQAQQRYSEIGNKNRTHFCGAYWFNGFHEDGVNSGLRVVSDIKKTKVVSETQHTHKELA